MSGGGNGGSSGGACGGGAVEAWQAAVDAFCYAQPYELARSRRRLAEALAAAGEKVAAGRAAAQAREVADRLGARPLRDAVDAFARRAEAVTVAHRSGLLGATR